MHKDLTCAVELGNEHFQADVHLEQLGNSNIIAEIVPNTPVTTLSLECFLESARTEEPLKLKKTHGSITHMMQPLKVSLNRAEFEYSPSPAGEDKVTVRMYVTNLPYFQWKKDYIVTV